MQQVPDLTLTADVLMQGTDVYPQDLVVTPEESGVLQHTTSFFYLNEIFTIHSVLGIGRHSVVLAASITPTAFQYGAFPPLVTTGKMYAVRLQSAGGYSDLAAQTEARVSLLLRRTRLNTKNIEAPLFWMRITSELNWPLLDVLEKEAERAKLSPVLLGSLRAAHRPFNEMRAQKYMHVFVMEYYPAGTLADLKLLPDRDYLQLRACAVQVIAAFAVLRTLIPDFKHNKAEQYNIFLEKDEQPGTALVYEIDAFSIIVPLFLTHGFVLKVADFQYASGTYITEKGTFKIGIWDPVSESDLGTAFPMIPFPDLDKEAESNYYHTLLTHSLFRELRCEKDQKDAFFTMMWKDWHPVHIPVPAPRFISVPISKELVFSPAEIKTRRK